VKHLTLRIWFLITMTPVFAVAIIRFIWEAVVNPFPGTITIVILVVLGFLGAYALLVYFTINPDLRKLKSLPFLIGLALLATGCFVSGIIHFIRFFPSPQASVTLSLVFAFLFAFAGVSAYSMILWITWTIWKSRKSRKSRGRLSYDGNQSPR
jgi:hypothetical protein